MYEFETPIVKTKSITKMDVRVINLVLFQSVSLAITLYTDDNQIYDNKFITLEGEDYTKWTNDDNYIIEQINVKLENELI